VMLTDLGYTPDMIRKAPAMFYKNGWRKFQNWLALLGVRKIVHRSHARSHYLAINCAELHGADYDTRRAGSIASPF
jgi:hypothetical protein